MSTTSWFNTPGDGTRFGFSHWGEGLDRTNGGRFVVDMWPEVSEYDPQDLSEVPGLKMPDGSPARLYSAFRKGPVLLHCKWMREYGIDGVFLSRFVGESANPARFRHINNEGMKNPRRTFRDLHRVGAVAACLLSSACFAGDALKPLGLREVQVGGEIGRRIAITIAGNSHPQRCGPSRRVGLQSIGLESGVRLGRQGGL